MGERGSSKESLGRVAAIAVNNGFPTSGCRFRATLNPPAKRDKNRQNAQWGGGKTKNGKETVKKW
jgi:hypothetical protein